ncbi:RDD family protein [Microlunatus flavus]|uniref:Uncharacterized membrane protein YckC, RDD family n=1 Tax=Microlunatus flavus TaxID=1036181 RepID=A0A1H9L3G1_9ACTN|nr:RDD family protein [Microlunatus flavus]SER05900.1 Uncharacterized membrane protein YckC, RDD family [Microlunatus flavus]
MEAARPPAPARDTGLPPGVRVGPLGQRFLAYVLDSLIPAVAGVLVGLGQGRGGAGVALVVIGALVALAWAGVCWQQLATRAATPGMRLVKLQLVGFFDGRPVGWGRVFVRWLVFAALSATGIGLLLLLVSLLTSPRHQGWHDRAATSVVIRERPLAPRKPAGTRRPAAAQPSGSAGGSRPEPAGQVAPSPAPVASPVAGDPAVGPELAPLAADPALVGGDQQTRAAGTEGARRTILQGWVAELDDGREIPVRGLVLLGRNPQPEEGETDAELVKLSDESRTVSKTHLALGVDDAGLFVVDRGSTNGSTITAPGQTAVRAGAFHAVPVSEGSVVSIGDHWVRIRRDGR